MAIRLISLTCEKCGATFEVNSELKKCICNYCGNEMLIDDGVYKVEHTHKLEGGYEYGYDKAYGELQARKDFIDNLRREKQNELLEQESLRREKEIEERQIQDELERQRIEAEKAEQRRKDAEYKNGISKLRNAWIINGCLCTGAIYLIYLAFMAKQLEVMEQALFFFVSAITLFVSIFVLKKGSILKDIISMRLNTLVAYISIAIALTLSTIVIYYNYSKLFSIIVLIVLTAVVFLATPIFTFLSKANLFSPNEINLKRKR